MTKTTTQIVLVPGFWLGAWAWDDVVPPLAEEGFQVVALSLPGRAAPLPGSASEGSAREGSAPAQVGPQDQADAIVAALDRLARRRVLVVHSGAAIAATLVIDQHPELVDHVVWVDTAPSADGYAMNADFTGQWYRLEDAWDEEQEMGAFRGLTDERLTVFRERAVPEPGAVVSTPVHLSDDRRHDVPSTVVCCLFGADDFRAYAERGAPFLAALPHYRRLELVDLPTGHWPMWSRPQDLARLIADAAG